MLNNCGDENAPDVRFSVYDALGNVVYASASEYIEPGNAKFSFDVQNNLKPGVYFFRGGNNNKIANEKVILRK